MYNYILSNSSIPFPGGREFIRQCVSWLLTWDALGTAAIIFAILLFCWVVRILIKMKEDEWDE